MAEIAEPPEQAQAADVVDAQGQPGAVESDPNHSPTDTPTNPTDGSEHRSDSVADGAETTEQARGGEETRSDKNSDLSLDEMDMGELLEIADKIGNGEITTPEGDPFIERDDETEEAPARAVQTAEVPAHKDVDDAPAPVAEIEHPELTAEESANPETKTIRPRLQLKSEDDAEVIRLVKEEGLSIVDAAARVREKTAASVADEFEDPPPRKAEATTEETATKPKPPEGLAYATAAEAEARLDELDDAIIQAEDDFDDDKARELRREHGKLSRQLPRIVLHENEQNAQAKSAAEKKAQAEYDSKWDASLAEAASLYPDLDSENYKSSELYATMSAINEEIKTTDPGLYEDPTKPLTIAKMAARRLALAPGDSLVSTTTPTPSPAKPAAVDPRNPAAQGVRTVSTTRQAPESAAARIDRAIDEMETSEDIERFLHGEM